MNLSWKRVLLASVATLIMLVGALVLVITNPVAARRFDGTIDVDADSQPDRGSANIRT